MGQNNNYIPAAYGWQSNSNYYVAPAAGTFNAVHATGSFAAYCTLLLPGAIQLAAIGATQAMHLWGNVDIANNLGWGIHTTLTAGPSVQFTAFLGNGVGLAAVNYGFTPDGTASGSSPIDRLIQVGLWYDATNLWLTLNGIVVAGGATAAMAPAANAARIGSNPTDPVLPASFAEIASVGYSNEFDLASFDGVVGTLAASAFDAARETVGSGYLNRNNGWDWTHRYDFRDASGGTIEKTAAGSRVLTYPDAPATLVDRGGFGIANPNLATNVAADLSRVIAGANGIFVNTRKNPDWVSLGLYTEGP